MKSLYIVLIFLFLLTGLVAFRVSYAFFSNSGTSSANTFTAASCFSSGTHIVINEESSDGQAKGEWVELFNPTCGSIDVSGWKISDKNASDNGQDDTFPAVSPIPAGGYSVVITNNTSVVGIPPTAITIELTSANIGNGLNDDGDAVHLKNPSNVVVDEMSYGNNHDVFNPAPSAPPANQSLARSPNGVDTNTAADWVVDTTPSIGVAN